MCPQPKLQLLLLVFMLIQIPLFAGNSIFSNNGMPCQYYGNDIYGMGMGDTGIADVFRLNTGFGNPALIAGTRSAVFSTASYFGFTRYTDDVNRSYTDNSMDFPYFNIVLPMGRHRMGFQFNSYSSGLLKNQITSPVLIDTVVTNVTEVDLVDSYLYRVDLMYSYQLDWFDFGVAGHYYLGHEMHSITQDAGFGDFNSYYGLNRTFRNPGFSLGFTKKYHKMGFGAVYTYGSDLNEVNEYRTNFSTEHFAQTDFQLPHRIALGATYNRNSHWKFSGEFRYDMWKNTDNAIYAEDSWKAGIGSAYEPSYTNEPFITRIPLRAGLSWRHLPFQNNGSGIDEKSATFGFSLPLKIPNNRLDFGLQYSMRGDNTKNNSEESSFMFMLGITGFDIFTKEHKRIAPREIPEVEEMR